MRADRTDPAAVDAPGATTAIVLPEHPIKGAFWMIAAGVAGAAMIVCIRHAAEDVHAFEIAFFRCFFALILLLPWIVKTEIAVPPKGQLKLHLLRAFCLVAAMLLSFWALILIPVLDATALAYTTPLFATVGAALFLKETVGIRRWLAIAVGFAGVLAIVRPGFAEIGLGVALALVSAVFAAGDWLTLKPLSRRASTWSVVAWLTLLATPMTLIPALFVWKAPGLATVGWLFGLGVAATLGQFAATRAFALADISFLSPFNFLHLIFFAAVGWLAFGEPVHSLTALGAAVVLAAAVYVAQREAYLKRKEAAAVQAP